MVECVLDSELFWNLKHTTSVIGVSQFAPLALGGGLIVPAF